MAVRYGIDFDDLLGLHFFLASDFKLYQLFTYMFVHGSLEHIFFNMFAVWMFGRIMERVMGSQRFLFYYIVCGVGAGLLQEGVQYIQYIYQGLNTYESVNLDGYIVPMEAYLNRWTTVGASGAVYGILLSFGMTFPNERMFIIPIPFPIKAKWFVIGYAIIELLSALGNPWRKHPGDHDRFYGGSGNGFGGFGGYDNYFTRYEDVTDGDRRRDSIITRIKRKFAQWRTNLAQRRKPKMEVHKGSFKHSDDMEWNRQQKARDEEIDRILAKVKQGGYDSLSKEEKRKLFDASAR